MGANRFAFPPPEGPLDDSWTEPLTMVHRALAGVDRRPSDAFFDLADFMIMARVIRNGRPDIQLYKHVHTRKYLNVDAAGHTYRYRPPRNPNSTRLGSYWPHRSLRRAIEDLWLWELPWMKDGLAEHRRGLSWDERWLLFDDATGDLRP